MSRQVDGTFGENAAEFAGLPGSPPTVVRSVKNAFFAATRLSSDDADHPSAPHPGGEPAAIIAVQMKDFAHRGLWVEGKRVEHHFHPRGSMNLLDMQLQMQSELRSGFDLVQLYLPHVSFERFAEENHTRSPGHPRLEIGVPVMDPIVENLARSLLPSLERPGEPWTIFVDHLALAFYTHLATTYGRLSRTAFIRRGGLAPWQHKRATEMLAAEPAVDVSLSDIAKECGLSVSHFTRAFRQSTGLPPHQWLIQHRVDMAKGMLAHSGNPLADIALTCGFTDQSHFTRVFSRLTGLPPGRWRVLSKD